MSLVRFIMLSALAAAIVPAAGCRGAKMYEGPRRPRADVAQVRVFAGDVLTVDGHRFKWHERIFPTLELPPGRHSATFDCHWNNYWTEAITVDFTVEAGHKYHVLAWEDTKISDARHAAETIASISPFGLALVSPILIADRIVNEPTGPPERKHVWVEDTANGSVVAGTRPPRPY